MLIALLLIPLAGALLLQLTNSANARNIALATAIVQLGVTTFALSRFVPDGSFNFEINLPWADAVGLSFHLGVDGMGMLLVLLTSLLCPFIIAANHAPAKTNEKTGGNSSFIAHRSSFYSLLLLMQTALTGVFMALDGLLFYIFYELALIPIYFICAIWGGEDRIRVTMKFFIYTFFGSLLMLVSLIYLYLQTPDNHSFALDALQAVQLSPEAATWVYLGFFIAFAVKLPIFPFHTWQPDTYTTAPTAGAMLLSGIMLKKGGYGLLRWLLPLAPEASALLTPVAITLSVIGIVYASIIAIKQTDIKRLIAYSSIAHVGLIAAGIFAWNQPGVQGSLLQMLNHGINVVGLFFVADILQRRLGHRSLPNMGGIARSAPRFAALFLIILLGAVAVPLTNGFPGEFLLLQGVWMYNSWLGAVAGLTIIFGAVYMLRMYQLAMFGEATSQTADFQDLDRRETVILGVIAGLVIGLGFFPQPILDLTADSVNLILGK